MKFCLFSFFPYRKTCFGVQQYFLDGNYFSFFFFPFSLPILDGVVFFSSFLPRLDGVGSFSVFFFPFQSKGKSKVGKKKKKEAGNKENKKKTEKLSTPRRITFYTKTRQCVMMWPIATILGDDFLNVIASRTVWSVVF